MPIVLGRGMIYDRSSIIKFIFNLSLDHPNGHWSGSTWKPLSPLAAWRTSTMTNIAALKVPSAQCCYTLHPPSHVSMLRLNAIIHLYISVFWRRFQWIDSTIRHQQGMGPKWLLELVSLRQLWMPCGKFLLARLLYNSHTYTHGIRNNCDHFSFKLRRISLTRLVKWVNAGLIKHQASSKRLGAGMACIWYSTYIRCVRVPWL